jgi:CelD/BcsL family acetyltransferase involved in cellulose biosynthesis
VTAVSLEVHNRFESLWGEWDELADRAGSPPFARPGWFDAWWRAFGAGTLEIVALRRGAELAAVLPLQRRRGALRSLTNWHTPEFELVAADAPAREALLRGVLERARTPILLGMLTSGRPDASIVPAAATAAGMRMLVRTIERSPYVRLDADWDEYERALPRRRRSELRRRRRRLEEQGALALDVADGTERLGELLAEGFAVEPSGWKADEGSAIVSHPETQAFYTAVARWAAPCGLLRLAFLRLDGRPLAFHFTIEDGRSAYQLKGGYDPGYRALAPGTLLIRAMLEWGFARGLRTYEFLGEDEGFKLDWTAEARDRLAVQAFPRSLAGSVGFAAFAYGRPLAKRARELAVR